jgi:large subunit ribosomal protein L22
MESVARARYVRISPRKLRQVVDLIKGKSVEEAMRVLPFVPKHGAGILLKVLKSAISNLASSEKSVKIEEQKLYIKGVRVDGGPMLKRYRAGSMGRVMPVRHRLSHITMIIGEKQGG